MYRRTGLVLIVALCATAVALGHARLVNSSPADGATFAVAPQTLNLQFSEAAQLAVLELTADGVPVPLQLTPDAKPTKLFSLALPALKPGLYRVEWTALAADDGHVTKGAFSFTIAAAH
jgi:methionine-rich copper-binding protein CopC